MRPHPVRLVRVKHLVHLDITLATLTLFLSGCTDSSSFLAEAAAGATAAAAITDEQLIAQPPNGWVQVGATNLPNLRTAQFVPEGESADDWTRRITFESLAEKPLPDPIKFVELLSTDQDRICGTFESLPTFAGKENGYPTAVYLLICHQDRDTKRSEITMIKTIQGNDFFYVITRARRGPPIERTDSSETADGSSTALSKPQELPMEKEIVGAWSIYLKTIQVCDPDKPEHLCP